MGKGRVYVVISEDGFEVKYCSSYAYLARKSDTIFYCSPKIIEMMIDMINPDDKYLLQTYGEFDSWEFNIFDNHTMTIEVDSITLAYKESVQAPDQWISGDKIINKIKEMTSKWV